MPSVLIRFAVVGLLLTMTIHSAAQTPAPTSVTTPLEVHQANVQSLALPPALSGGFHCDVVLDGRPERLVLRPHSWRSSEFHLLEAVPGGGVIATPAPAPQTLRGVVLGWPESRVAGSLTAAGLEVLVLLDDEREAIAIQPLSQFQPFAPRTEHVVHDARDAMPSAWQCGVVHQGSSDPEPQVDGPAGLLICDIALDLDYEYVQDFSGNTAVALNAAETMLAGVTTIYERDTSITYQLTRVVFRPTPASNPYTSNDPNTLLNQFRGEWQANLGSIPRDVAHLLTGRSMTGTTIGLASVGVICTSNAYGLSERYTSNLTNLIGLTAHELGHNWNARHCTGSSCHIMCATLGGCGRDVTDFSAASISTIVAHRNSRSCLATPTPTTTELGSYVRPALRIDPGSRNVGLTQSGYGIAGSAARVISVWSEIGNAAVGRRDILGAISLDEGLTYGPSFRIDLGDGVHQYDSIEPRVVATSPYDYTVIWREKRETTPRFGFTTDLYVSHSNDAGQTWDAMPVALNDDTDGANIGTEISAPTLVASGSRVQAFWLESGLAGAGTSKAVRTARSLDAGATFSSAQTLSTRIAGNTVVGQNANDTDGLHVAQDGQRIALVFVDDRNPLLGQNQDDVYALISLDGGASWSERAVESSTTGIASQPRVAWAVDGPIVTWLDDEIGGRLQVRSATSTNQGASFAAERTVSSFAAVSPAGRAFSPRIASHGNGVLIAWVDDADATMFGGPGGLDYSAARFASSTDGGRNFSSDQELSRTPFVGIGQVEVLVAGDQFHAYFLEGRTGQQALYWTHAKPDGVAWATPRLIERNPNGFDYSIDSTLGAVPFIGIEPSGSSVGVVYDRVVAQTEPFAVTARAPGIRLFGDPVFGTTVRFIVDSAPTLTGSHPFVIGVSASGESPATHLGAGIPLLHLVPDLLFFTCFVDPVCQSFTTGTMLSLGLGVTGTFTWPVAPGGPDLTFQAVILNSSGTAPEWFSLPLTIGS